MQTFSVLPFNVMSFRPDLWIDAGDIPFANGTRLDAITNKGLASVAITQSTANRQSQFFRNDVKNGRAYIYLADTGGANEGYTTNLTLGSQWAIFVAERPYVNLSTSQRTVQGGNPTNSLICLGRNTLSSYNGGTVSVDYITAGEVGVGCFKTGASGNHEFWLQGVNRTTVGIANAAFGAVNLGAVGMFNEAGYTRLYETIIFNRFVSDTERAAINVYLMAKYGAVEGRFSLG